MLFDHLMHDVGWLKRYTPLATTKLDAFVRSAAFEELHMLRRYAAKLLYEIDLHGGEIPFDKLPERYVERLTRATSFRYDPAEAFVDVDPRYYAARYLRAWQLQALLTETLIQRYNEDWWRNPKRWSVDHRRAVRRGTEGIGPGAGDAGVEQRAGFRAAGESDRGIERREKSRRKAFFNA